MPHPTLPMRKLDLCTYLSEEPSKRFPVYTRGNVGEVWPDAVYPLSFSMSRWTGLEEIRDLVLGPGVATADEVAEGFNCFGGVFGGYMYLNLSFQRVMAVRTPGTTIEESDSTFFSADGIAPPHVPQRGDKRLRASLAAVRYVLRLLGTKELQGFDADRAIVRHWQRRLPELLEATDGDIVEVLEELTHSIIDLFIHHLDVTNGAGAAVQILAAQCENDLDDRSLVLTLLGGLGDIDSAAPSFALWDLGRSVAVSPALTAHFDAGPDGLEERLRDDESTDTVVFCAAFDDFLERYGARGQNEWETASETWGTSPAQPLALIDRMRSADADHEPGRAAAELAAARQAAIAEARGQLRWFKRRIFDRALRSASIYSQGRERAKTNVVDLIHVSRRLLRELGRRTSERVAGATMLDMWFVGFHELPDYVADPASFVSIIAERRAARQLVSARLPPMAFSGRLPDPAQWELRQGSSVAPLLRCGEQLTGVAGCAGVAEGRARIVLDPTDPGDIGPGDVLVAPLTDPSWTPLFVPVEAVVVNVGGQMSHAVIVARELGQPCVVAATDATVRIADGARIRVDGAAGTVTVLEDPGLS